MLTLPRKRTVYTPAFFRTCAPPRTNQSISKRRCQCQSVLEAEHVLRGLRGSGKQIDPMGSALEQVLMIQATHAKQTMLSLRLYWVTCAGLKQHPWTLGLQESSSHPPLPLGVILVPGKGASCSSSRKWKIPLVDCSERNKRSSATFCDHQRTPPMSMITT